jgi:hypothetical protein
MSLPTANLVDAPPVRRLDSSRGVPACLLFSSCYVSLACNFLTAAKFERGSGDILRFKDKTMMCAWTILVNKFLVVEIEKMDIPRTWESRKAKAAVLLFLEFFFPLKRRGGRKSNE